MPKLLISWAADVEGLSEIKITPDARYYVKLKCTNCGEESKEVYFNAQDKVELSTGRGDATFVLKCKGCKRENSLDVVPGHGRSWTEADETKFVPLIACDCRGLEIVSWEPRAGFTAVGTTGKPFEDVNLGEDFADYDEAAGCSVSVMNVKHKIEKIK
eukprot:tig00001215_g7577.t1